MIDRKMLAVRLPPVLVYAIKDYAANEGKSVALIVEEFIRNRLVQNNEQSQEIKKTMNDTSHERSSNTFRLARRRGEVMGWREKKMLVARLPSEIMDTLRNSAVAEHKNIVVFVEELIYLELKQRKCKLIETYEFSEEKHEPFRRRHGNVSSKST